MIILLGGSSHVGKTWFSQKLMERYQIPYVSLDHLKMAFIRTGMTDLTVEDDYEMRYFLWPFAAEMIKTAIENHQNMIVEGCYIPDTWEDSFDESYRREIRPVFLVMSRQYLLDHFDLVKDHACVIEQRKEEDLDLERLIACSDEFRSYCITSNLPYVEIDGSFDSQKILADIISALCLDDHS